MMIVGRVCVSSVTVNLWNSGHFLDHAGWGPLQKGHSGSSLGHLLGAWVPVQRGQMGFWEHSEAWCPSVKHLAHWTGVGGGALEGSHLWRRPKRTMPSVRSESMVITSSEISLMRGVGLLVFLEMIRHILWTLRWGALIRMSRSSMSWSTSLMTIENRGDFFAGFWIFLGRLMGLIEMRASEVATRRRFSKDAGISFRVIRRQDLL